MVLGESKGVILRKDCPGEAPLGRMSRGVLRGGGRHSMLEEVEVRSAVKTAALSPGAGGRQSLGSFL